MALNPKMVISENERLKECVKVLIEYKEVSSSITNRLNSHLTKRESTKLQEVVQKVEDVFKTNKIVKLSDITLGQLRDDENQSQNVKQTTAIIKVVPIQDVSQEVRLKCSQGQKFVYVVPRNQIQTLERGRPKKKFVCSLDNCHKRFDDSFQLKTHQNKTHLKLDFICKFPNCSFKTWTQFGLNRHMESHKTQSANKLFVCDFPNCDYKSNKKLLLDEHRKSHSTVQTFICGINGCHSYFDTQRGVNRHRLTHSLEYSHKCTYEGCNKSFKSSTHLKRHANAAHLGVRYACEWPGCTHTSTFKTNLKNHELIHKNERNYFCLYPNCGKSFYANSNLKSHLTVHKGYTQETPPLPRPKPPPKVPENPKPLRPKRPMFGQQIPCEWPGCTYSSRYKGVLSYHYRNVHQSSSETIDATNSISNNIANEDPIDDNEDPVETNENPIDTNDTNDTNMEIN